MIDLMTYLVVVIILMNCVVMVLILRGNYMINDSYFVYLDGTDNHYLAVEILAN